MPTHRHPPSPRFSRRDALKWGAAGGGALLLGGLAQATALAEPVQPWRRYPSTLYSFSFPEIEGLTDNGSDTWYTGGKVVGRRSGHEFAFSTIFCKNRPLGPLLYADFYTFALFDLDTGDYGTYTLWDLPPAGLLTTPKISYATGHLGLSAGTPDGDATWVTRRTPGGALDPFRYHLDLLGTDQSDRPMRLDVDLDPQNAPSAPGGDTTRGVFRCFGQDDTLSYFQTGTRFRGTLTWGDHQEEVEGTQGHIDRQLFPLYAGVDAGLFSRDNSHEWRSINLDDGTDLAVWRQFDRTDGNSLQPFSGATRYLPDGDRTVYAPDVEVTTTSFVKWPSSMPPLIPPPSPNRYLPDVHELRVPGLDLALTCTPLVPVPAHSLPFEYMIGPVRWDGTLEGRPISGFGFSERSLSLYRIWELGEVLRVTVAGLPASAYGPDSVAPDRLAALAEEVAEAAEGRQRIRTTALTLTQLRPAVLTLTPDARAPLLELLGDLDLAPID